MVIERLLLAATKGLPRRPGTFVAANRHIHATSGDTLVWWTKRYVGSRAAFKIAGWPAK
jgi:hypothetical protein